MQTPLEMYEAPLSQMTDECVDPWFAAQLAASRAGDEEAVRRISGSCLPLVLDIAKREWQAAGPVGLLDLVQEGNRALVRTIRRFTGSTAEEFLPEVRRQVEYRLTLLLQHPGLVREEERGPCAGTGQAHN